MRRVVFAERRRLLPIQQQRLVDPVIKIVVNIPEHLYCLIDFRIHLGCDCELVVLDVLRCRAVLCLKPHLYQRALVLAELQLFHALAHTVFELVALCNRLMYRCNIVLYNGFSHILILFAENIPDVTLHRLALIAETKPLIFGKLRDPVRRLLGVVLQRRRPSGEILPDRLVCLAHRTQRASIGVCILRIVRLFPVYRIHTGDGCILCKLDIVIGQRQPIARTFCLGFRRALVRPCLHQPGNRLFALTLGSRLHSLALRPHLGLAHGLLRRRSVLDCLRYRNTCLCLRRAGLCCCTGHPFKRRDSFRNTPRMLCRLRRCQLPPCVVYLHFDFLQACFPRRARQQVLCRTLLRVQLGKPAPKRLGFCLLRHLLGEILCELLLQIRLLRCNLFRRAIGTFRPHLIFGPQIRHARRLLRLPQIAPYSLLHNRRVILHPWCCRCLLRRLRPGKRPSADRTHRGVESAAQRAAERLLHQLRKAKFCVRVVRRPVRGEIHHIARALLGRLNAHLPQEIPHRDNAAAVQDV